MTDEPKDQEAGKKKELPPPSWKKIGEFLLNILQLERSVTRLQQENRELNERLLALQRQVDEQAGELKVLVGFVQTSLRDQIDTRAERAVVNVLERLIIRDEITSSGNETD